MSFRGQNLRVFINNKCIAVSTSCTFNFQNKTEDASTKDSTGDYEEFEVVSRTWDVSCESLYDPEGIDAGIDAIDPSILLDKITDADPTLELEWKDASGTKNRGSSDCGYAGKAIFDTASVTSPNRQKNTASFHFLGTGPLVTL